MVAPIAASVQLLVARGDLSPFARAFAARAASDQASFALPPRSPQPKLTRR
jgi:hypothetical protein